jgi:hypothetical protein
MLEDKSLLIDFGNRLSNVAQERSLLHAVFTGHDKK